MTSLDKLQPGDQATVIGYASESAYTRRLVEIGLVPGRIVTYVCKAPLRDPIVVRVGHSDLTLRHRDAASVRVEPIGELVSS